jgi:hypothetical protein
LNQESLVNISAPQLKVLARDLVRRRLDRSSRPLRILTGRREYARRRAVARELTGGFDIAPLERTGYTQVHPDPDAVGSVVAASTQKLADAQALPQRGNKPFFSQLLGPADHTPDSVFLRFALDDTLLTTVARYLRCAPFLNSVELLYSKPLGNANTASQLWHRDRRDLAIIKVFVYATDVGMEHGPLTVLPLADSRKVPEFLPHYLTDAQIGRYVPMEHVTVLTGPAGTTWMVDSENCYHLGSRCEQPRLAYVAYYDSGFGYRPRETNWARLVPNSGWTLLQRFALGLV